MKTVLGLVLTAFFVLSGAACLPQGAQRGGIVPGTAVIGAAGDVRSAAGNASDTGGMDAGDSGPAAPPPEGKFDDATPAPSDSSGRSMSVTYMQGPTPMPAGSGAPSRDPGDQDGSYLGIRPDRTDFFRGSRVSECTLPMGRTLVHVTGRESVSFKGGPEQSLDLDQSATLLICYATPGYGRFECIEAPFAVPDSPVSVRSVMVASPPRNYVDASVITSDPASLSYHLILRAIPDRKADILAKFAVIGSVDDASPESVSACINFGEATLDARSAVPSDVGPEKDESMTNVLRTKE